MKKARIVVREDVIGTDMKECSDMKLQLFNGIYYSPFEIFDDHMHSVEVCELLMEKYKKEYRHLHIESVELQFAKV